MTEWMAKRPSVLGGRTVFDTQTLEATEPRFALPLFHPPSERVWRIPGRPDRHGLGSLLSRPSRAGGESAMGKTSVLIRAPLLERLKVIAEDEGMPVQELIDFVLRSFTNDYDFEEDDADTDLLDEDSESESQDEKA